MTFLLTKVSGVAMLERTLKQKPGFEDYMRKTSAFLPWLPKS
jgi:steroid 5-alpha reductase family enzyme